MPEEPIQKKTWRQRYNEARENMRDNKIVQWAQDNRVTIGVGIGGVTFGYLLRGKSVQVSPTFNNTVSVNVERVPQVL